MKSGFFFFQHFNFLVNISKLFQRWDDSSIVIRAILKRYLQEIVQKSFNLSTANSKQKHYGLLLFWGNQLNNIHITLLCAYSFVISLYFISVKTHNFMIYNLPFLSPIDWITTNNVAPIEIEDLLLNHPFLLFKSQQRSYTYYTSKGIEYELFIIFSSFLGSWCVIISHIPNSKFCNPETTHIQKFSHFISILRLQPNFGCTL